MSKINIDDSGVSISIGRPGQDGDFPLSAAIFAAYNNDQFMQVPEIGQSIEIIRSSVAISVDTSLQKTALAWAQDNQDAMEDRLHFLVGREQKPIWIELHSEQQTRGVLLAPAPDAENPRLTMVYWILANGRLPSMIPILSDWVGGLKNKNEPDVPVPERSIIFRETPGTRKMITFAGMQGEIPEAITVQDLCVPVMHMAVRALSCIAYMMSSGFDLSEFCS
jgi:hypothetical protein